MVSAIANYHVKGVKTTLAFGRFVMEHEAFTSGNFDTHFVKKYYNPEALNTQTEEEAKVAAIIGLKQYLKDQKKLRLPTS